MPSSCALEICVESVDCAVAAERGQADRIELCSELASEGITPSAGLMTLVRRHVRLPIHVLIRPRAGGFRYSRREFETMEEDIRCAQQLGMDGIVLGILDAAGQVDVERTTQLVALAHPLPVTFHHAFDVGSNLRGSLDAVIETGAKRVLTSGGLLKAASALGAIAQLVEASRGRISVMPGGGIDAANVGKMIRHTGAREIHTSLTRSQPAVSRRPPIGQPAVEFEEEQKAVSLETTVRELKQVILATLAGS